MKEVLLVDDDPDVLDSLKTALELSLDEIEVHTAASGRAALDFLRERHVELIITDYRMPGMTGGEFLAAADEVASETPRILISAFPESALREALAPTTRVDSFLPKPMDVEELIGATRRYLS